MIMNRITCNYLQFITRILIENLKIYDLYVLSFD
jgi:hypothetical protein